MRVLFENCTVEFHKTKRRIQFNAMQNQYRTKENVEIIHKVVNMLRLMLRNGKDHKWIKKFTSPFHVHYYNKCNFLLKNVSSNLT